MFIFFQGLPFPVPMPPLIADVCVPNHCTEPDLENIIQTCEYGMSDMECH